MTSTFATILGGVGLFLLGMILMTDGLKAIAGDALRRVLGRFTGNRFSAVATGTVATLIVQSSTATTLATIGFVSAGLLAFPNAIGVIIGANLGTTSIGWIVSLLGLKFSIGTFAMPLVGIGALMRLLGRNRIAEAGHVLAGFGLIFIGIDVLQDGMAGLEGRLDLGQYGASGLWSRLALVGIGLVMTIVMQSSSASVATTLAAVASGTIGVDQAAALVIGHNIGTTLTGVLAAMGASVQARRTALVHVIFNVTVGLLAFFILPQALDLLQSPIGGEGADQALVIAAFHTVYAVVGALIFVPIVPQLARFVSWMLPEQSDDLVSHLDPALRDVPALAVAAAITTLRSVLARAFVATGNGLVSAERTSAKQYAEWRRAAEAAGELLERLAIADRRLRGRLTDTLHLLDHVRQFVRAGSKPSRYDAATILPTLRERAAGLGQALIARGEVMMQSGQALADELPPSSSMRLGRLRTSIMDASSKGELENDEALAALGAQRWLERLNHHARRSLHYLHQLGGAAAPAACLADADSPPPLVRATS